MGLGTIFFRICSDFMKKRAKKVGKFCIFLELPKNVIFGFKYLKYEIYSKYNIKIGGGKPNKVNTLRGSPQSLSYCKCVIKSMSLLPIHLGISDH